ncbi:MAG: M14-type cytosolic carboxypeptidase [Bacteroidota bacterium]|nr:M14-type cytosolic carboxypeptidase [Bacteroidota bacterium]
MKFFLRTFFLVVFSSCIFSQVRFDANFESGNLESVSTTDSVTYLVKTREDIGGRWFYFKMSGIRNKFIRVKVINSDVTQAMYSYDNQSFQRFSALESPQLNTFEKTYTNDSVFVSYYTPYSLSYLNKRISSWSSSPFFSIDTIGYTKRNLPLYEIKITDRSVADSLKEHIWIHARTHPGETTSSWHFDGIMKTLLSNDEAINYYLKNLVFHLVPFTNPDGVYFGRSRTNVDGIDLESNWNEADSLTSKEVLLLKQKIKSVNAIKTIKVFLNLHSQASQFCTFWIHTASSTSSSFYRKELQFSNINISDNPYFKFNDFSYSNLSSTFPEGWQWKNWTDKTMALTYETPYDVYSTGLTVDSASLAKLGERTIYSIAEYLDLSHPKRMILDNSQISSTWTVDSSGYEFFGRNFMYASPNSGKGSADFSTGIVQKGKYDIYGWWPSNSILADNTKITLKGGGTVSESIVNQKSNGAKWNYLGSLSLGSSGEIVISVNSNASNFVAADAFRVIYSGLPVNVENQVTIAKDFQLYQNYPNPFNSQTIIKYQLQESSNIKLLVYNSLGQIITTLVDEVRPKGRYEISFDGKNLSSGVYYIQLSSGNKMETRSMLLLK